MGDINSMSKELEKRLQIFGEKLLVQGCLKNLQVGNSFSNNILRVEKP